MLEDVRIDYMYHPVFWTSMLFESQATDWCTWYSLDGRFHMLNVHLDHGLWVRPDGPAAMRLERLSFGEVESFPFDRSGWLSGKLLSMFPGILPFVMPGGQT